MEVGLFWGDFDKLRWGGWSVGLQVLCPCGVVMGVWVQESLVLRDVNRFCWGCRIVTGYICFSWI